MGSNHVGNGLAGTGWSDLGNAARERPSSGAQPNMMKDEGRKHSVGGIISGRTLSDRTGSELNTSHKNNEDVAILISKYKRSES